MFSGFFANNSHELQLFNWSAKNFHPLLFRTQLVVAPPNNGVLLDCLAAAMSFATPAGTTPPRWKIQLGVLD